MTIIGLIATSCRSYGRMLKDQIDIRDSAEDIEASLLTRTKTNCINIRSLALKRNAVAALNLWL